jgi:TnpA family transposase
MGADAYNIGADEHESHFVFDILFNNNTDIEPEIHSTDTHGTNEVNFALLHVFGYQFAPRYKDLCDKTRTSLTGFRHPSRYGDAILRPARKIREKDIIREWMSAGASSCLWRGRRPRRAPLSAN